MNDAAAMLEILLSRGENQAPYRLIEILAHWAAPRTDVDLSHKLDGHPRSAWFEQIWASGWRSAAVPVDCGP